MQITIYCIWSERNSRIHRQVFRSVHSLFKDTEKQNSESSGHMMQFRLNSSSSPPPPHNHQSLLLQNSSNHFSVLNPSYLLQLTWIWVLNLCGLLTIIGQVPKTKALARLVFLFILLHLNSNKNEFQRKKIHLVYAIICEVIFTTKLSC